MQCTTHWPWFSIIAGRIQCLVLVSWLVLALQGQALDSVAGWLTCPPAVYTLYQAGRGGRRRPSGAGRCEPFVRWPLVWGYLRLTWRVPLARSLTLSFIWLLSRPPGLLWWVALPWLLWLWRVVAVGLPWLGRQPEWWLWWRLVDWGERGLFWVYWGLVLSAQGCPGGEGRGVPWGLLGEPAALDRWGLSVLACLGPSVQVSHDEEGHCYRAEIKGDFRLSVADGDPFRRRLLVLFLRQLLAAGEERGSRRTRDGRTPFVRQQDLARAVGVPQPDISRWEEYWLAGDWRRLLSQRTEEVLTVELQGRIIRTWARLPGWGVMRIHRFLVEHGFGVTESQVSQAAQESGWQQVREVLGEQCAAQGAELRLRDRWLVGELLRLLGLLLEKVEKREGLTAEEQLEVAVVQAASGEAGLAAPPPLKALPWLLRVERIVFGQWEMVTEGQVHCLYCGSPQVSRKSRQPREKRYWDAEGQLQRVAVYRYYCHNPACLRGSFTDLPLGLVPYSRYRTEAHLLAVQMYAWGHSNYRRTGAALGVASVTAYRWVSALGQELLPVAALFGVVKSSGVVGVDEKYVLVPKNDKPAGKMRRWMYVYFAVDVYTYDLLHLAVFPDNTEESAQAFLLALRAKGYHPRVVVTDLRQDYGPVLTRVFPQATHHECIFHALQNVQAYVKEVYGRDYPETHPEAERLKEAVKAIFQAKSKRTAGKRYAVVQGLRTEYLQAQPRAAVIFEFLDRHWPKLVNGIESDLIVRTNNTVELVIRRFDQHYQNFCGFERLETAALYLAVFEKLYRFTPFSRDAQPHIRGQCPLQLAGYDISQLPMASLCRGLSIIWPTEVAHVPNS